MASRSFVIANAPIEVEKCPCATAEEPTARET